MQVDGHVWQSNTMILYINRKEGGRGLHSIEDVVNAEEQRLKSFISRKAYYERPLHGAWHKGVADLANTYQS